MVNYRELQRCLDSRREYKHGSSHAIRTNTEYQVYSYSTLMLTYNCVQGTVTFFNAEYYSRTTSRLQNMIRQAFDVESVKKEEVSNGSR